MIPNKFSGLSILLILALLVSTFAFVVPAAPVQAQTIGCTINSPSTSNITYTNGSIGTVPLNISFSGGDGVTTHDVKVYVVTSGGTQLGYSEKSDAVLPSSLGQVTLPSVGIVGYGNLPLTDCYLQVTVDGPTVANQVGTTTVIINNTVPIISTPTSPTISTGWSTLNIQAGTQDFLTFSISSASSINTVTVNMSTDNLQSWTPINNNLNTAIPTGAAAFSSYNGYYDFNTGGPLSVGTAGQFYLQIIVKDAYGNTTTSQFGPFNYGSSGPYNESYQRSGNNFRIGREYWSDRSANTGEFLPCWRRRTV